MREGAWFDTLTMSGALTHALKRVALSLRRGVGSRGFRALKRGLRCAPLGMTIRHTQPRTGPSPTR